MVLSQQAGAVARAQLFILASGLLSRIVEGHYTRFPGVYWDDEKWRLTTTVLDQGHYQSRMSLSNGYLGINLAALGPFFERGQSANQTNGWPLFDQRQTFATIAGFHAYQTNTTKTNFEWLNQYGGEDVISGVPHWAGLTLQANGSTLDASTHPSEITKFQSTLDLKGGVLTWQFDWRPSSNQSPISVEYRAFVHKLYINRAAIQLKITTRADVHLTVIDKLEGDCAVRTEPIEKHYDPITSTICSGVRPVGVPNVTAHVCSTLGSSRLVESRLMKSGNLTNSSTIAQAVNLDLKRNQTFVIEKFIGGASSDSFTDPKSMAWNASLTGAQSGFSNELKAHRAEWETILTDETVDNFHLPDGSLPTYDQNLVEQQILAITDPFHLLQNIISPNAISFAFNDSSLDVYSIPVCGLGSSCYAGLVFWDAEVWMAPGLLLSHPEFTSQITNYRVEKYRQARDNIKMAFTSSHNQTYFSTGTAVYPWTSGRSGKCSGVGPCFDYEYHLNSDIGLHFYNSLITTGDLGYFKAHLFPIYDSIAIFFSQLLKLDSVKNQYVLYNATDPDEYANHVNNPAFTMASIKSHLVTANQLRKQFNQTVNQTWQAQADRIQMPIDEQQNIILEYDGMNSSTIKQADVVLIDDLLDYPNRYALSDLKYYGKRQSLDGPAMTYGVYSIVANRLVHDGCASYTYGLYASQPYVRAPWFQFSEQLLDDPLINGGTHPAFPFLTGIGSHNRVTVYGYLGLRLRMDHLNIDPFLPPQIPSLKYRRFYWQGHPIRARSNQTHTVLWRENVQPLLNANAIYSRSPIPVIVGLSTKPILLGAKAKITIRNRLFVPKDPLQCQPIKSTTAYEPAQFPLSITDGSTATFWKPTSLPSTVTIPLNNVFINKTITGFVLRDSTIGDFTIQFYNSRNRDVKEFEGSQLSISEDKNQTGLKIYQLKQPIGFKSFVNLTVFNRAVELQTAHQNKSVKSINKMNQSNLPSLSEFVLITQ